MSIAGQCLTQASPGNGTQFGVATCNGAPSQVWAKGPNGVFMNQGTGKCVSVPSNNFVNGQQLESWDCWSYVSQLWKGPA